MPLNSPRGAAAPSDRLRIDVHAPNGDASSLADDARVGLSSDPRFIPPKYFYDEHGSKLFAAICDLPEYYLTRTEQALLDERAAEIIALTRPTHLVELGSGNARKTRALLDAIEQAKIPTAYLPFDVSEPTLRQSSLALLDEYPWLRIHGLVGDYERHFDLIPPGDRRLIVFLGSTIGNLDPRQTARFLGRLAVRLGPHDHFLLGTDLVKPRSILEAAYNDSAGVTAEFNLNLLRVMNRELGADFDANAFEHLSFFNARASRIEMHLRARRAQRVRVAALGRTVRFAADERLRTEISRKFTRASVERMLGAAGFRLLRWITPANDWFALSLSRRA